MESRKKKDFSSFFRRWFPDASAIEGSLAFEKEPREGPEDSGETLKEVMDSRERSALGTEENRRQLNEAAVSCIKGNDISQNEIEFSRQYHLNQAGEDEKHLKLFCNSDIFGRDAALFKPYAEAPMKGIQRNKVIGLIAEVLNETGKLSVEPVDYTSPEEIREKVPEVMNKGLRALTLRKAVQGTLRDQVNGYLILNEGIDSEEAQARWKQLDALVGARNGAIDILKCYSSNSFVRGKAPGGRKDWHQAMSDCCCSLHFFKEDTYQSLIGVPIRKLGEAEAAYMGIGGDHRAFFEAEDKELFSFLRGERGTVTVSHRTDYLSMAAQAQKEQEAFKANRQPEKESRRRIGLKDLQSETKAKERRSEVENREKNIVIRSDNLPGNSGPGRNPGDSVLQPSRSHYHR